MERADGGRRAVVDAAQVVLFSSTHTYGSREMRVAWYLQHLLSGMPLSLDDASDCCRGCAMVVPVQSDRVCHEVSPDLVGPGVEYVRFERDGVNGGRDDKPLISSDSRRIFPFLSVASKQGDGAYSSPRVERSATRRDRDDEGTNGQAAAHTRSKPFWFRIRRGTRLMHCSRQYNVTVMLDVGVSMCSVCDNTGRVLIADGVDALKETLEHLIDPLEVHGVMFRPRIHVSVLTHGSGDDESAFECLVYSALLNKDTFVHVWRLVMDRLQQVMSSTHGTKSTHRRTPSGEGVSPTAITSTNDLNCALQRSIFVLKLMQEQGCPMIVLITDGVCASPDYGSYDNMIMMLNREEISVHVVQVGDRNVASAPFPFIGDSQMLRTMASKTHGAFLTGNDVWRTPGSVLRRLLLVREFGVDDNGNHLTTCYHPSSRVVQSPGKAAITPVAADRFEAFVLEKASCNCEMSLPPGSINDLNTIIGIEHPFPWVGPAPTNVFHTRKCLNYAMPNSVGMLSLVRLRIREGFRVESVTESRPPDSKGPTGATVRLVLEWQANVRVKYAIMAHTGSRGASEPDRDQMVVSISVESYYGFIHMWASMEGDLKKQQSRPDAHNNPMYSTLPGKLFLFLGQLRKSDQVFVILEREQRAIFAQSPAYSPTSPPTISQQSHLSTEFLDRATEQHTRETNNTKATMLWRLCSTMIPSSASWYRWFRVQKLDVLLHIYRGAVVQGPPHQVHAPPVARKHTMNAANVKSFDAPLNVIMFELAQSHVLKQFEEWSTISPAKNTFLKLLADDEAIRGKKRENSSGFVVVHLKWKMHSAVGCTFYWSIADELVRHSTFDDIVSRLEAPHPIHPDSATTVTSSMVVRLRIMSVLLPPLPTRSKDRTASSNAITPHAIGGEPLTRASRAFRLMNQFMSCTEKRWIVESSSTRHAIVERIVQARLDASFWCTSASKYCWTFFFMCSMDSGAITMRGCDVSTHHDRKHSSPPLWLIIQYVVANIGGAIVTEVWTHPVPCRIDLGNGQVSTVNDLVLEQISTIDLNIVVSLSTIQEVLRMSSRTYLARSSVSESTTLPAETVDAADKSKARLRISTILAAAPKVSLLAMLARGRLERNVESPVRDYNEVLGHMLESSLLNSSDCEIDTTSPMWLPLACSSGEDVWKCRCFIKRISDKRAIIIVVPMHYHSRSALSSSLRSSVSDRPTLLTSTSSSSSVGHDDWDLITIPGATSDMFFIAMYECSASTLIDVTEGSRPLPPAVDVYKNQEEMLGFGSTHLPRTSSSSSMDETSSILGKLLRRELREYHEYAFAQVMFTQLRDVDGWIPRKDDLDVVLNTSAECSFSIDVTQYFRILSRLQRATEECAGAEAAELLDGVSREVPFEEALRGKFRNIPGTSHFFYCDKIDPTLAENVTDQELEEDAIDEREETADSRRPSLTESDMDAGRRKMLHVLSLQSKTALGVYPLPFFVRLELAGTAQLDEKFDDLASLDDEDKTEGTNTFPFASSITDLPGLEGITEILVSSMPSPNRDAEIHVEPRITRATLRVVCTWIRPPGVMDEELVSENANREMVGSLPEPVAHVLDDLCGDLEQVVVQRTLRSLKGLRLGGHPMLQLVLHNIQQLRAGECSKFNLEPYLLPESEEVEGGEGRWRQLLDKELVKNFSVPLRRQAEYFYAVDYPGEDASVVGEERREHASPTQERDATESESEGESSDEDDGDQRNDRAQVSRSSSPMTMMMSAKSPPSTARSLAPNPLPLYAASSAPNVLSPLLKMSEEPREEAPSPVPSMEVTSESTNASPRVYRIPFWLIILSKDSTVQVWFYPAKKMSNVERSQILSGVRASIRRICHRVNQHSLLQDLHRTHICSSLLVPPATADEAEETALIDSNTIRQQSRMKDEMQSITTLLGDEKPKFDSPAPVAMPGGKLLPKKFPSFFVNHFPGQFACPLVYEVQFKLHERLSPLKALADLATIALHPMQVLNRHNLFVYQEVETRNIYYLRLKHVTLGSDDDGTEMEAQQEGHKSPKASREEAGEDKSGKDAVECIVLEAYGIREPHEEVMSQFAKLLQNQLASSTIVAISNLLARNPHLSLTKGDISFLQPSSEPSFRVFMEIPSALIPDQHVFVMMLRDTLLYYLNSAQFMTQGDATWLTDTSVTEEPQTALPEPISADDLADNTISVRGMRLSFLYNYMSSTRTTSAIFKAIGQGLAFLHVRLRDRQGGLAKSMPCSACSTKPAEKVISAFAESSSSVKDRGDMWRRLFSQHRRGGLSGKNKESLWFCPLETMLSDGAESEEGPAAQQPLRVETQVWLRDLNASSMKGQLGLSLNHAMFEYAMLELLISHGVTTEASGEPTPAAFVEDMYSMVSYGLGMDHPNLQTQVTPLNGVVGADLYVFGGLVRKIARDCMEGRCAFSPRSLAYVTTGGKIENSRALPEDAGSSFPPIPDDVCDVLQKRKTFYTIVSTGPAKSEMHLPRRGSGAAVNMADNEPVTPGEPDNVEKSGQPPKVSFCMLSVTCSQVVCWTWNVGPFVRELLKNSIAKALHFTAIRQYVLSSALHQKLGLFTHVARVPELHTSTSSASKPEKPVRGRHGRFDRFAQKPQNTRSEYVRVQVKNLEFLLWHRAMPQSSSHDESAVGSDRTSAPAKRETSRKQSFSYEELQLMPKLEHVYLEGCSLERVPPLDWYRDGSSTEGSAVNGIDDPVLYHGMRLRSIAIAYMRQQMLRGALSVAMHSHTTQRSLPIDVMRSLMDRSRIMMCQQLPFVCASVLEEHHNTHVAAVRSLFLRYIRKFMRRRMQFGPLSIGRNEGSANSEQKRRSIRLTRQPQSQQGGGEDEGNYGDMLLLKRHCRGGLMTFITRFKGADVEMILYSIPEYQVLSSAESSFQYHVLQMFSNESHWHAAQMHFMPYVYDFHVRLVRELAVGTTMEQLQALIRASGAGIVSSLLQSLQKEFPTPPPLSCGRVQTTEVELSRPASWAAHVLSGVDTSPTTLFQFLAEIASSLGFTHLQCGSEDVLAVAEYDSPNYTLIVTHSVGKQNEDTGTENIMLKVNVHVLYGVKMDDWWPSEYGQPPERAFAEVLESAVEFVIESCTFALDQFRTGVIWDSITQKLQEGNGSASADLSSEGEMLSTLASIVHHRPLSELDSTLSETLNWVRDDSDAVQLLFAHLESSSVMSVQWKEHDVDSGTSTTQLMIFSETYPRMIATLLCVKLRGRDVLSLSHHICRRLPPGRAGGEKERILQRREKEVVESFGSSLLYVLWRSTIPFG